MKIPLTNGEICGVIGVQTFILKNEFALGGVPLVSLVMDATPAQIAEAQALAKKWAAKYNKE